MKNQTQTEKPENKVAGSNPTDRNFQRTDNEAELNETEQTQDEEDTVEDTDPALTEEDLDENDLDEDEADEIEWDEPAKGTEDAEGV